MSPRPTWSFFNEQPSEALERTFTEPTVSTLAAMGASVSMALLDRSEARAQVVRRLNAAKVPVVAWLVTSRAQGYFATATNADAIAATYDELTTWARERALAFHGIGLDFEPPLEVLERLMASPLSTATARLRRARQLASPTAATARYRSLVEQARADGLMVESYVLPTALADRAASSDLWARALGTCDVPTDREVVMLYTSVMGPVGRGVLEALAPRCAAIGLGSTGGGLDPFPKLSAAELARDLSLAAAHASHLAVFSLEGLVATGALAQLANVTLDPPRGPSWHRLVGQVLGGAAAWLAR